MHKQRLSIPLAWVKLVNNLSKLEGLNRGNSSTNYVSEAIQGTSSRVQTGLTNNFIQTTSTMIYTCLNSKINLLNKTFTHYPQHLLINQRKEI
jgi:hypothetical protein